MDNERVDLSALEPEAARWESVMAATMGRVEGLLAREAVRDDALITIAGWSRPLLLAAAAALLFLVPVEIALEKREARVEAARRLADASMSWAAADRAPSGNEILRTIATRIEQ